MTMQRKNASQDRPRSNENANEGEGSVTAARRYDEGVKASVERGTQEGAEKARKAVEGKEGEELRHAESVARRGNPTNAPKAKRVRRPAAR
jgi:hypothetical protein